MGAMGCCDRDSVYKNIDSPKNKYKSNGLDDKIINISPKGTPTINLYSKDMDLMIEKSKAKKKDKEIEIDSSRYKSPVTRDSQLIKKHEMQEIKNQMTTKELIKERMSINMKSIFNDKEIIAGEYISARLTKSKIDGNFSSNQKNEGPYHSNRKTRESIFREEQEKENKIITNELSALNIDKIYYKEKENTTCETQIIKMEENSSKIFEEHKNNVDKKEIVLENNSTIKTEKNILLIDKDKTNLKLFNQKKIKDDNLHNKVLITDPNSENENSKIDQSFNKEKIELEQIVTDCSNKSDVHQNSQNKFDQDKKSLISEKDNNNIVIVDNVSNNSYSENEKVKNSKTNEIIQKIEIKPIIFNSSECKNVINESQSKSINPGLMNRMQIFEKKSVNNNETKLNPSTSSVNDKKSMFEKKFSIQNNKEESKIKEKSSFENKLEIKLIKNSRFLDSNDVFEKKLDLSKTMQIPSSSNSPMKERIKLLEEKKLNSSISNASPIYVLPRNKTDQITVEEEADLKSRLRSLSLFSEVKNELEENKKLKHKKSIRINNIAKELERHLLKGDENGNLNPQVDYIIQSDEFTNMINDKPFIKDKKKTTKQVFI